MKQQCVGGGMEGREELGDYVHKRMTQDTCPPWSHPRVLVYPKFHARNIKEMDDRGEEGI